MGTMDIGNFYYVNAYTGDDNADGTTPDTAVKSCRQGLALATANHHDTVYFIANSNTEASTADFLTSALDWNKDGVNLIGIGNGNNTYIGSRSKIINATTSACPANMFTLSANNCIISGLEIMHHNGVADLSTAEICMVLSGMRNVIMNCQISGIGGSYLDTVGSASLYVTGAENYFSNCYIGLDTVIRAECLSEIIIGGSGGSAGTRNIFENCIINSYTSSTSFKGVLFSNASSHTMTIFKDCIFNAEQNRTSAAQPTGAIDPGSVAGHILDMRSGVFGYVEHCTGGSALVEVVGPVGAADSNDSAPAGT